MYLLRKIYYKDENNMWDNGLENENVTSHEKEYAQTLRDLFPTVGSPTRNVFKTLLALWALLQHVWVLRISSR